MFTFFARNISSVLISAVKVTTPKSSQMESPCFLRCIKIKFTYFLLNMVSTKMKTSISLWHAINACWFSLMRQKTRLEGKDFSFRLMKSKIQKFHLDNELFASWEFFRRFLINSVNVYENQASVHWIRKKFNLPQEMFSINLVIEASHPPTSEILCWAVDYLHRLNVNWKMIFQFSKYLQV